MRFALLALLIGTASAQAQTAAPADVSSPEAIVAAVYDAIARAPGDAFDWDRFRSLFLPNALLIPNTEQNGGAFQVFTPDEYVALVDTYYETNNLIGGPDDKGFAEEQVAIQVERYGDVAQAFSTYQKRYWDEEAIIGRGINSVQLVFHEDRWWVVSIAWDEEYTDSALGGGPIPDAYLD